jgi:hypothetical protein
MNIMWTTRSIRTAGSARAARAAAAAGAVAFALLPAACSDDQDAVEPPAVQPTPAADVVVPPAAPHARPSAPATPEYDEAGLVERAKAR